MGEFQVNLIDNSNRKPIIFDGFFSVFSLYFGKILTSSPRIRKNSTKYWNILKVFVIVKIFLWEKARKKIHISIVFLLSRMFHRSKRTNTFLQQLCLLKVLSPSQQKVC